MRKAVTVNSREVVDTNSGTGSPGRTLDRPAYPMTSSGAPSLLIHQRGSPGSEFSGTGRATAVRPAGPRSAPARPAQPATAAAAVAAAAPRRKTRRLAPALPRPPALPQPPAPVRSPAFARSPVLTLEVCTQLAGLAPPSPLAERYHLPTGSSAVIATAVNSRVR